MTTALLTHPACLGHDLPAGHPESAARLRAVLEALNAPEFTGLLRVEAAPAPLERLALVHDQALIALLSRAFDHAEANGTVLAVDSDTLITPDTRAAALCAAGAVCDGIDLVMAGRASNAFCAIRPPGHHAEPATAMGFCFYNSIAIGAAYARERYGLARVAIVDFDVHHGNGTQQAFAREAGVLYISTHQAPFYPGTGHAHERGAFGNILNLPLPAGAGSAAFRTVIDAEALPALRRFAPDLLLISAGFDAHAADPLANLRLTESDFAWVTRALMELAEEKCAGRIVSALEGGYDLEALARSVAAHVATLMGGDTPS